MKVTTMVECALHASSGLLFYPFPAGNIAKGQVAGIVDHCSRVNQCPCYYQ